MTDQTKDTYGWIGLGAMGWGMATVNISARLICS